METPGMADPLPSFDSDMVTVDEFYALVPDGQKADLLDGVIYLASPDSERNDEINQFLVSLLRMFVSARRLGRVTGSRFAYRLTERRAPEPDVAFVATARVASIISSREGLGPPDVAVEIVARDSRVRDYGEKKQLYESSGVAEYWIVDPLQRRCEFHRLQSGRYVLVPLEGNRIFRSTSVPGFWIDVEWLIGPELPSDYECLQLLLSS
ncbi:MAG: Uma2 family endonuclease [Candidatus Eremiobacterota bacterium]